MSVLTSDRMGKPRSAPASTPSRIRGAATLEDLFLVSKAAAKSYIEDYAPSMGAAIAYYTMLSIAPLLLIVVTVAGLFFGEEAARGALTSQLQELMGENGATAISAILGASDHLGTGVFSITAGTCVLVFGATTVFAELQSDLDRIWKVPAPPGTGVLAFVRARLMSFGIILGVGFLLVVSLVLSAAISAISTFWGSRFTGSEVLLQVLNFGLGFVVTTLLFALIYKLLPSVTIVWRDVWTGAAVTSLLFSIGKFFIGLYIGKTAMSSSFGAAGALVVLIVWVYYSAQIFLIGAEFTYQYAKRHGSLSIPPPEETVPAAPA